MARACRQLACLRPRWSLGSVPLDLCIVENLYGTVQCTWVSRGFVVLEFSKHNNVFLCKDFGLRRFLARNHAARIVRASFNGRTLASQANNVGSIPIARSRFSFSKTKTYHDLCFFWGVPGEFCPIKDFSFACSIFPDRRPATWNRRSKTSPKNAPSDWPHRPARLLP